MNNNNSSNAKWVTRLNVDAKCKSFKTQLSQYNEIRKLWPGSGMFK